MPTYDYECKKCGHKLEIFHKMSDPSHKICPKCKKEGLVRLIGKGSGIIFKGSGFYETDYKKKKCPSSPDKNSCKGCKHEH